MPALPAAITSRVKRNPILFIKVSPHSDFAGPFCHYMRWKGHIIPLRDKTKRPAKGSAPSRPDTIRRRFSPRKGKLRPFCIRRQDSTPALDCRQSYGCFPQAHQPGMPALGQFGKIAFPPPHRLPAPGRIVVFAPLSIYAALYHAFSKKQPFLKKRDFYTKITRDLFSISFKLPSDFKIPDAFRSF